ncbi:MAG: histidine kinase [Gammaproteobacteria bacterium HGW-Gammaproteobacteria-2]|nr:MAG: histidine kinase [Gammaproteobacteria bacterium HGW-Gammaproteobacteria-2]
MRTVAQLLQAKPNRILTIAADDSVLQAVQRMAEAHVGALMVIRNGQLVGIVSERDYSRKVILKGRTSASTLVHEIMSAPVITVEPDKTTTHCMQVMTDMRIRHLPVVDEDGPVLGMVSIGDLVRAVIEDQQLQIEQLQHYIAG